jgi:hypothetical protein
MFCDATEPRMDLTLDEASEILKFLTDMASVTVRNFLYEKEEKIYNSFKAIVKYTYK